MFDDYETKSNNYDEVRRTFNRAYEPIWWDEMRWSIACPWHLHKDGFTPVLYSVDIRIPWLSSLNFGLQKQLLTSIYKEYFFRSSVVIKRTRLVISGVIIIFPNNDKAHVIQREWASSMDHDILFNHTDINAQKTGIFPRLHKIEVKRTETRGNKPGLRILHMKHPMVVRKPMIIRIPDKVE